LEETHTKDKERHGKYMKVHKFHVGDNLVTFDQRDNARGRKNIKPIRYGPFEILSQTNMKMHFSSIFHPT
jgi:hypothetical protein